MKKDLLLFSLFLIIPFAGFSQVNYLNPASKFRSFGPRDGKLDSLSGNPQKSQVNNNYQVIKYDRSNSVKYDNIKIYPIRKLVDVSSYATHSGNPPKIKMKVFTSAPKGTKIEIQLGRKGDDNYPSGVHSQYEAVTKSQNQWEELTFDFSQIPAGSQVPSTDVDKITVLFSPGTSTSDTFYFDDLVGPPLVSDITNNK